MDRRIPTGHFFGGSGRRDPVKHLWVRLSHSHEFMFYRPEEWPEDFQAGFAVLRDTYINEWKTRFRQLWQWDRLLFLDPDEPETWPAWLKRKLDINPLFLNQWVLFRFWLERWRRDAIKEFRECLESGRQLPRWLQLSLAQQPDLLDRHDLIAPRLLPLPRAKFSPYDSKNWPFWLVEVISQDESYLEEWRIEFDLLPSRVKPFFDEDIAVEHLPLVWMSLVYPIERTGELIWTTQFEPTKWLGYVPENMLRHPDYGPAMKRAVDANKKRYRLLAAFGGFHGPLEPWLLRELDEKPTLLTDLRARVEKRWPKFLTSDIATSERKWGILRRDKTSDFFPKVRFKREQGYFWWPENTKIVVTDEEFYQYCGI